MVLAMARPVRLPNSRHPYARKVVPAPLRAILGRTEFKRPLHGSTSAEIKRLHAEALAEWETLIESARAKLAGKRQSMTARQIEALCGEWYRAELAEHEDDPASSEAWQGVVDALLDRAEPPADEYRATAEDLTEAEGLWMSQGVAVDDDTVKRTARRLWQAKIQAAKTLGRRAAGDWRPDENLARFPSPEEIAAAPSSKSRRTTGPKPLPFSELIQARALEDRPPEKSREKWEAAARSFASVAGHDDARRITVDEVRDWKQRRAAEGRSQKTIADGIATLRALLNWGARNGLLPKDNPFSGTAPKLKKHGQAPRDGYTDEQARTLLAAARNEVGWKRWLPWVLAFTGARIEEVAELRRRDVRQEGGVWILDIVPTATRAGKTAQAQRMVPIHPALVAEGFLDYAASLPADGPLWPDLRPGRYGSRGSTATKAHSRWVRGVVGIIDRRLAPAHSWRHRMEDQLRIARVGPEAHDAITGHDNPRNAGAGYGRGFRGMPDELLKELRRVPSPLPPIGPQQGPVAPAAKGAWAKHRKRRRRPSRRDHAHSDPVAPGDSRPS
ncbi:MAG: hypothetical protein J0H67_05030 [Rhodospirillales bacterium]|nr:hypothetical protein [Rhodospirillales bacterium]